MSGYEEGGVVSEDPNGRSLLKKGFSLELIGKYRTVLLGIATLWVIPYLGKSFGILFSSHGKKSILTYFFVNFGDIGFDIFLFLLGVGLYFMFSKDAQILPFIKRGLKNVAPAILIICGAVWGVCAIILKGKVLSFLNRILFMRFWLQGDKQVWLISLLIPLFLLYPVLYHYLFDKEKGALRRCSLLIAGILVFNLMLAYGYKSFWAHTSIAWMRIPIFIVGCYFGELAYKKRKLPAYWIFLFAGGVALSYCTRFFYKEPSVFMGSHVFFVYLLMAFGAVCFCCVLAALFELISLNKIGRIFLVVLSFLGSIFLELYLAITLFRDEVYVKYFMKSSGNLREYFVIVLVALIVSAVIHFGLRWLSSNFSKWRGLSLQNTIEC